MKEMVDIHDACRVSIVYGAEMVDINDACRVSLCISGVHLSPSPAN